MSNPFTILQQLAEQKISQAIEQGELDDLPGQGRPLPRDDISHVPEELRMAYRLLKNAGYTPPEVEQRKEITRLVDLLENCEDEQVCMRRIQKLNLLITKLNEHRKSPVNFELDQVYYRKVVERVRLKNQKSGG
ncbi:MAG: DUF1992 domain-containing protein [Desulfohalobiaceae bacterium]|nr:DUF1992 domain-containing protein [Desulfohalobiaceae bacterium]